MSLYPSRSDLCNSWDTSGSSSPFKPRHSHNPFFVLPCQIHSHVYVHHALSHNTRWMRAPYFMQNTRGLGKGEEEGSTSLHGRDHTPCEVSCPSSMHPKPIHCSCKRQIALPVKQPLGKHIIPSCSLKERWKGRKDAKSVKRDNGKREEKRERSWADSSMSAEDSVLRQAHDAVCRRGYSSGEGLMVLRVGCRW